MNAALPFPSVSSCMSSADLSDDVLRAERGLVEAAMEGDGLAFRRLVEPHLPMLLRVAARVARTLWRQAQGQRLLNPSALGFLALLHQALLDGEVPFSFPILPLRHSTRLIAGPMPPFPPQPCIT